MPIYNKSPQTKQADTDMLNEEPGRARLLYFPPWAGAPFYWKGTCDGAAITGSLRPKLVIPRMPIECTKTLWCTLFWV